MGGGRCDGCPLTKEFLACDENGYGDWCTNDVDRLKWARKFLGQLYYLKHKLEREQPKEKLAEWVDVTEECVPKLYACSEGHYIVIKHSGYELIGFGKDVSAVGDIDFYGYKVELEGEHWGGFRVFKRR